VSAQIVTAEGDTSPAGLQQRYTQAAFKEELADAVCGEADKARVKIENLKGAVEDAHVVYSADVACAAVKFLQIGERRAAVRQVIAPDVHYRLVARAQAEDFAKQRATIDAFFASFRVLPAVKAERAEK
jgi:predicted DCC family thiol-disulfide oxidoreductase YuxK